MRNEQNRGSQKKVIFCVERLGRLFCHSAISFVHRYEMVGVFLSLSRKTVRDHYVYDVYEISI